MPDCTDAIFTNAQMKSLDVLKERLIACFVSVAWCFLLHLSSSPWRLYEMVFKCQLFVLTLYRYFRISIFNLKHTKITLFLYNIYNLFF